MAKVAREKEREEVEGGDRRVCQGGVREWV